MDLLLEISIQYIFNICTYDEFSTVTLRNTKEINMIFKFLEHQLIVVGPNCVSLKVLKLFKELLTPDLYENVRLKLIIGFYLINTHNKCLDKC